MFWGFSEAIDLFKEYANHFETLPEQLNILLYGNCDPRNILKTVAKSYKHDLKINFFVVDGCMELVARNLLLLSIAFEDSKEISVKNKVHIFMDVYGNSLIRPTSQNYISSKAEVLIKVVTDPNYLQAVAPIFIMNNLKYKERDGIETAFKFWKMDNVKFDMTKSWEARVRRSLSQRYDHREGAFDWDLQMKLKDRNAKQICSQEYKHWRDTGVAFTFPEYENTKANRTLVAGLDLSGHQVNHRGYVGDIFIGPFCTFGLKCADIQMLKSNYGTNEFRATDITERNIFEIMYEIHEKEEYNHNEKNSHKYGSISLDLGHQISDANFENVELRKYNKPLIKLPNVQIIFLPVEYLLNIHEKKQFQNFFDIIFIGNLSFILLKSDILNIFKEQCLVLFETKLHSVTNNNDVSSFLDNIKKFAKTLALKPITNFNINVMHSIVKYKRN